MAEMRTSTVIFYPRAEDIRLDRGKHGLYLHLAGNDAWFSLDGAGSAAAEAAAMDKLALTAGQAARELRGDTDATPRPGDLWATGSGMVWFAVDTGPEVVLTNADGDGLSPDAVAGLYGPLTLIHRQPATAQDEDGGDAA